jgi:hypothetical protein
MSLGMTGRLIIHQYKIAVKVTKLTIGYITGNPTSALLARMVQGGGENLHRMAVNPANYYIWLQL